MLSSIMCMQAFPPFRSLTIIISVVEMYVSFSIIAQLYHTHTYIIVFPIVILTTLNTSVLHNQLLLCTSFYSST